MNSQGDRRTGGQPDRRKSPYIRTSSSRSKRPMPRELRMARTNDSEFSDIHARGGERERTDP